MVLNKDEYLSRIQGIIGEDTSDEAMQFIEDMTDTFDNFSANDGEDWKAKYEENDKSWREKYKARFFGGAETDSASALDSQIDDVEGDGEEKTFDDLFVEREG